MQLTKEITKVIDNFLHEKGIYGVDCDDLEHKIAETINGKECRITTSLEKLCESCKKEGINVDGLIEYYGDYDGKYEIIGTVFHEYSSDEYAVKESVETRDLISPSLKGKLLQMIEEMERFVIESPEKCTKTMQSMKKLLIDTKDR